MTAQEPLLIRAMKGEHTEEAPIWLMRQAGRYLPEYLEIRSKNSMLDVIRTPELAAEVTLQPLRRFPLDAAIIFADILNPLIGMGMDLDFVKGQGPVISNPIKSAADVDKLVNPDTEENIGYTLKAISLVAEELSEKNLPVIGFCGAPFTLSAYMIEGTTSKRWEAARLFMYTEESAWHKMQEKLVTMLGDYLVAQAKAGASALQIFDSWVGILSEADYKDYVLPYINNLLATLRERTDVPLVYFAAGSESLLPVIKNLDCDVLGVDWRMSLKRLANLGIEKAIQGNLDPAILASDWKRTEKAALEILEARKNLKSHIFNLGHGIWKQTPVEHVERLVALVKGV